MCDDMYSSTALANHNKPITWSTHKVKKWCDDNGFHTVITHVLSRFNGEMLEDLYRLSLSSPEFFFNGPEFINVDTYSRVVFLRGLKNLFCLYKYIEIF